MNRICHAISSPWRQNDENTIRAASATQMQENIFQSIHLLLILNMELDEVGGQGATNLGPRPAATVDSLRNTQKPLWPVFSHIALTPNSLYGCVFFRSFEVPSCFAAFNTCLSKTLANR